MNYKNLKSEIETQSATGRGGGGKFDTMNYKNLKSEIETDDAKRAETDGRVLFYEL